MTIYEENIPLDLRLTPHWVAWKNTDVSGKTAKIPIDPKTLKYAKVNDPTSWGEFEDAAIVYIRGKSDGIGFVFSEYDPFIGVDLDKCLHPDGVLLTPKACKIVDTLNSYTEISPSKRGLHIIVKGNMIFTGTRRAGLEVYQTGRFFTITSELYPGAKPTIKERSKELEKILLLDDSERRLPANLNTCPLCPTFAITKIHSPKCPRFKSK